jgi:hypothetical protein
VPPDVGRIADHRAWQRRTLVELLCCRDLRLISVWHPTFLSLLFEAMERDWDELCRAVRCISRRRARELACLSPTAIANIWPRLAVVSAWGDAAASGALASLATRLGSIAVQPKGIFATECAVSLPYRGTTPLAVRSHVFEFEADDGTLHRIAELDEGASYDVIVTTMGGLMRYRTGDRALVTGRLARTPTVRLVGRSELTSDMRGEKLHDTHITQVLPDLLRRFGVSPRCAMLVPDTQANPPRYVLLASAAMPGGLAEALDQALADNPHYALCRTLEQLGPVVVREIASETEARIIALRAGDGMLGGVKPMHLDPDRTLLCRLDLHVQVAENAHAATAQQTPPTSFRSHQ